VLCYLSSVITNKALMIRFSYHFEVGYHLLDGPAVGSLSSSLLLSDFSAAREPRAWKLVSFADGVLTPAFDGSDNLPPALLRP